MQQGIRLLRHINAPVLCRELTVAAPFSSVIKPSSDKAATPAVRPQKRSEVCFGNIGGVNPGSHLQIHRISKFRPRLRDAIFQPQAGEERGSEEVVHPKLASEPCRSADISAPPPMAMAR